MSLRSLLLTCCLITTFASAQPAPRELNLMPLPAAYQMAEGQLSLDGTFTVGLTGYKEPRLSGAVQRFLRTLSRETGMAFPQDCVKACVGLGVYTDHASKPVQELGEDESYSLEITAA